MSIKKTDTTTQDTRKKGFFLFSNLTKSKDLPPPPEPEEAQEGAEETDLPKDIKKRSKEIESLLKEKKKELDDKENQLSQKEKILKEKAQILGKKEEELDEEELLLDSKQKALDQKEKKVIEANLFLTKDQLKWKSDKEKFQRDVEGLRKYHKELDSKISKEEDEKYSIYEKKIAEKKKKAEEQLEASNKKAKQDILNKRMDEELQIAKLTEQRKNIEKEIGAAKNKQKEKLDADLTKYKQNLLGKRLEEETQIAKLADQRKNLSKEMETARKKEYDKLDKEIALKKQNMSQSLTSSVASLKKEQESLSKQVDEKTKQINLVTEKMLAERKKKIEEEQKSLKNDIEAMKILKDHLASEIADKKKEIEVTKVDKDRLAGDVRSLMQESARLTKKEKDLLKREHDVKDTENSISKLKEELRQKDVQSKRLSLELEKEQKLLMAKRSKHLDDIDFLEKKKVSLKNDLSGHEKALREIINMKSEEKKKHIHIESSFKKLADKEKNLDAKEKELYEQEQKIKAKIKDIDSKEHGKVALSDKDKAQYEKMKGSMMEQIKKLESEVKGLETKKSSLKKEVSPKPVFSFFGMKKERALPDLPMLLPAGAKAPPKDLDKKRKDLDAEIKRMESYLASLNNKVQKAEKSDKKGFSLPALPAPPKEDAVPAAQNKLNELKLQIRNLETEAKDKKRQVDLLDKMIRDEENKHAKERYALEQMQKKLDGKDASLKLMEAELGQKAAEMSKAEKEIEIMQNDWKKKYFLINDSKLIVEKGKKELQELLPHEREQLKILKEELDVRLAAVMKSKSELADDKRQITSKLNELESVSKALATREKEVVKEVNKISKVKRMLSEKEDKIISLVEQMESDKEDIENLNEVIDIREKDLKKKELKFAADRQKLDVMKDKISTVKELKEDIDILKRQHNDLLDKLRIDNANLDKARQSLMITNRDVQQKDLKIRSRESTLSNYEHELETERKLFDEVSWRAARGQPYQQPPAPKPYLPPAPKMTVYDVRSKKEETKKQSINEVISNTRELIANRNLDAASANLLQLEMMRKEIGESSKSKKIEYQILELKTDLELASLS